MKSIHSTEMIQMYLFCFKLVICCINLNYISLFKYSKLKPDSDNINDLNYLDMFVKEALRLYPIGNTVVARRCTSATNACGIEIPLDLSIVVDVMSLHMDPDIWGPNDPNEFYPLRLFILFSDYYNTKYNFDFI